jgi:DNA-binding NarL/FixJ family response regulator
VFSRTLPYSPGYPHASGRDNRCITRPKVLIVTPHPVIGAGIETVLRLEDLYEVRRVGTLTEGITQAKEWPADAALVDGVLVEGGWTEIGVPCYVLSGDAASGQRLAAAIPTARGWLLKDAPPSKLVAAIDDALGIMRVGSDVRGTIGTIVAVVIVLVFIAALGLFLWRYFVS